MRLNWGRQTVQPELSIHFGIWYIKAEAEAS